MINQADRSTTSAIPGRDASERPSSGSASAAAKFQEILSGLFGNSAAGFSVFPFSSDLGPKRIVQEPAADVARSADEAPQTLPADLVSQSQQQRELPELGESSNQVAQRAAEQESGKHIQSQTVDVSDRNSSGKLALVSSDRALPKEAVPQSKPLPMNVSSEIPEQLVDTLPEAIQTKISAKAHNTSSGSAVSSNSPLPASQSEVGAQPAQAAVAPAVENQSQPSAESVAKATAASKGTKEPVASNSAGQQYDLTKDARSGSTQTQSQPNAQTVAPEQRLRAQSGAAAAQASRTVSHAEAQPLTPDAANVRIERSTNTQFSGSPSANIRERLAARDGGAAGKAAVANQAKFITQIQKALDSAARSVDGNTLTVKLEDIELGAVALKVTKRADQIFARVQSERPDVEHTLRGQVSEIVSALQSAGFKPENIHVSFGSEQSDQSWGAFRQQQSANSGQQQTGDRSGRSEPNSAPLSNGSGHRGAGNSARAIDSGWVA